MALSTESVASLLGSLYEAASAPAHWPRFLDAMRYHTGASRAYFVLEDAEKRCDLSTQVGFDEQSQRDYISYYAQHDILFQNSIEAQRKSGGDWIGDQSSVVRSDEWYRSIIFNEFMKAIDCQHVAVAALAGMSGALKGGLGMQRSAAQGPFNQDAITLVTVIAPHIKRALALHKSLVNLRCENADLTQTIEEIACPIVSAGVEGAILRMTSPARAILDARNGLCVSRNRLVASIPSEQRTLDSLVRGAAATASGRGFDHPVRQSIHCSPQAKASARWTPSSGGAMLISRRPPSRPLQVVVSPFRSVDLLLDTRPSALIFLSDPDARPLRRGAVLRALYSLSPTEVNLSDCLIEGMELKIAADHLRLTENTARFHLKEIFRKVGVHSQSALLRLSLGLPGTI